MKAPLFRADFSPKKLIKVLVQVTVLVVAIVLPMTRMGTVGAAQLTGRSVAISDSRFSQAAVTYVFTLKMATLTNAVQGVKIEACTTATGACTPAPAFSFAGVATGASTEVTEAGWDGAQPFDKNGTGANDCLNAANIICLARTDATVENDTSNRTITIQDINNASDTGSNNTENVYLKISLYTTSTWTAISLFDAGTVVTAMINQLSIQATVEETLTFCLYTGANCAAGGILVDMGVQSTASTDTDSNTKIDIAANANNGISVGYYSTQTLTSGSNTITSAGTSGTANSAGTQEMFGFCANETGTGVVVPVAPYSTDCNGTGADTYAYDATGTFDQIASSSAASDLSVLTLKFATDVQNTTESGVYTTTARFIAIPTY